MDLDQLARAAEAACGVKFRIWGGDGERQEPPGDGDGDEQQDKNQQDGGEPADSDSDGAEDAGDDPDGDSGDDGSDDLEDKLDAEKRKNIALKAKLTRLENEKKKAQGDREAAAERDELRAENDKLKAVIKSKFLEWSIQSNPKYDWVDVEDVVKALDAEAIEIDFDKGEVDGLDLELKRIAKKKPHWLKQAEGEGDRGPAGTGRPPSGSHPFGGKVTQSETEKRRIGEKFRIPGYGSQAIRPV